MSSLPETIRPDSPEASYLNSVLATQAAMQPAATDAFALLTRYIFIPFWSRELSFEDMRNLGGMPTLEAGYIIPIIKYQTRVPAYEEIAKVQIDPFTGKYMWTQYGVDEEKLVTRPPREVLDTILELFNRDYNVGGSLDNGICEVEMLRGNKEFDADFARGSAASLAALNRFCLPEKHTAARLQVGQLQEAVDKAPSLLHKAVAERLLKATRQSVLWAEARYRLIERQVEAGKTSFFSIDYAIFEWLEKPEPRRRSNLAGGEGVVFQQPAPVAKQIWCENCGTTTSLSPEGRAPRFCPSCKEPFGGQESPVAESKQVPAEPVAPVASPADQQAFSESVGDVNLERKQQEMRDRQPKRR